ncbi:MAG: DNA polymerase-3 subunit alpha (Gram-positive type) [Candidatus Azotimanducaceae bacterium]|jgi:DNA polymerase-3 subunit alpha (Gram-positive type)
MSKMYIALDFETTGLNSRSDGIIEIGGAKFEESGEIIDTFQRFANPRIPIGAEAKKVHGIQENDLKDAETPRECWEVFLEWASDDYESFVAHNAGFEIGFIRALYGGESSTPEFNFIDTLALSRRRLKGLSSYKLSDLVPDPDEGSHRALVDAKACVELASRIAATYKSGKMPKSAAKPASSFAAVDNKPSRRQLEYIESLGGDPDIPETKGEASRYIDLLKDGDFEENGFPFWKTIVFFVFIAIVLVGLFT